MLKNLNKYYHITLDILCVHAKFREKDTFFVSSVKKSVKMSRAKPLITSIFVFLTRNTEMIKIYYETTLSI
jgi:hypothetical protein